MNMMRRPRFLCDVDDVVVSYSQGFVAAVIATGVRAISQDHVFDDWDLSKSLKLTDEEDNKVYSLINMPGFAQLLNPLPGAVEGVKKIMEIADVIFTTSPLKSSPTWSYDRRLSLEKHFGDGVKICSTSEKYAVKGDFLCDDKPEHCASWQKENPQGTALLWSTGRNLANPPARIPIVCSWEMVFEFVSTRAKAITSLSQ